MENKKIYVALIHYHNNHYQAMGSTKDDAIAKLRNNIKNEVFDKWTSQRNYSLLRLDEKWSGFSRHVSGHVNNHAVLCTTECLSHIWNPGETKKEIDSKGNYFVVYEFDYNKEIKSLKNEALLFISFFDRVLNNINNDCKVIDEYQIENSGYYILQNIQKIKKDIIDHQLKYEEIINGNYRSKYPYSIMEIREKIEIYAYAVGYDHRMGRYPEFTPVYELETYKFHWSDKDHKYYFGNPDSNFLVDINDHNAHLAIAYSFMAKNIKQIKE